MKDEFIDFRAADLECSIYDLFGSIIEENRPLPKEEKDTLYNKFRFLMRKLELYNQALIAGFDYFDWNYAHGIGWLCEDDYRIFEELKGLDPKDRNIQVGYGG